MGESDAPADRLSRSVGHAPRRSAGKPVRGIRAWWRAASRLTRIVLINVVIGFAVEIVVQGWLERTPPFRAIEDGAMDAMIRLHATVGTIPHQSSSFAYYYIDIDDATYEKWGEPLLTPRDKLARLVTFARHGAARAIVVDVALDRVSSGIMPNGAGADSLLTAAIAADTAARDPPIVMARTFSVADSSGPQPCLDQRHSFLEESVPRAAHVYWAAPLFERRDYTIVRDWRLWQWVCGSTPGSASVVPSVQLLTTVLLRTGSSRALMEWLTAATVDASGRGAAPYTGAGLEIAPTADELSQRVIYGMPWRTPTRPTVPLPGGGTGPVLDEGSAGVLADTTHRVDSSVVRGRVVIIGGSSSEARDVYATPVGPMPGGLILANATQSLSQYNVLRATTGPVRWLLLLGLIVVVSIIFARMHYFWAQIASSAVIVIALLPFSFLFFKSGQWLDFAGPLVAVQIHHAIAEFEDVQHRNVRTHSRTQARGRMPILREPHPEATNPAVDES